MRRLRLGIRQSLFFAFLALVVTMTSLFLALVSFTMSRGIERTPLAEMVRSRDNFRELERQRQEMLLRQTALLSELPSLKALMTTNDQPTIVDAAKAFWQTSGSDLFALMGADGSLLAVYLNGSAVPAAECTAVLARSRETPYRTNLVSASGRFFEVATEPISFASGEQRRVLGYISTGYELNDHMAQMIGRSPSGQVIFATSDRVIASTLDADQKQVLKPGAVARLTREGPPRPITMGSERYLTTSLLLQGETETAPPVYLVVLQSYQETTALLHRLDVGVLAIGAFLLLIGGLIALTLAGTVTRPLETLLHSTRQMARGETIAAVPSTGPSELRELREAFENMHTEVLSSQAKLIEGERQATIGRMASSISHDLRHYLSPIYANAEFLSSNTLSDHEREELLDEIAEAARGMNDLLEAILTFSRTGIAVQTAPDSITMAVRRALARMHPHPDARGVAVETSRLTEVTGWIDGKELQRAVYNLLLNACQSAQRTSSAPCVRVSIELEMDAQRKAFASIRVRDNGEGVSGEIASRLFEPFVSAGKQSGVGLGLALVKRIAEAHGGSAGMRRIEVGAMCSETEFFLLIPAEPAAETNAADPTILGATS